MITGIKEDSTENIFISKPDQIKNGMVFIPASSFFMGSKDWGEFERPVHEVYVEGFWMDETPITNKQFHDFVCETGHITEAEVSGSAWGFNNGKFDTLPGLCWKNFALDDRQDHPVVLVSWDDASAYAKWAGKRLPTEAEWEKAARGGLEGRLYPWGDEEPDNTQCNFAKSPSNIPPTTKVKQFSPNGYGLYDMVGNVWQWCSDYYGDYYYAESPDKNPTGPDCGLYRLRRGASWNVTQSFRLRCANRGAVEQTKSTTNISFRCCI